MGKSKREWEYRHIDKTYVFKNKLSPGDFFGHEEILLNGKIRDRVISEEDSWLFTVTPEQFYESIKLHWLLDWLGNAEQSSTGPRTSFFSKRK